MSADNGATPASEVKARTRRLVEAPSGCWYLIGQADLRALVPIVGIPEPIAAEPGSPEHEKLERRAAAMVRGKTDQILEATEQILAAALISPKVGPGEDEIAVRDIPNCDLDVLVMAAIELSGSGKKAAASVRPTSDAGTS